MKQSPCRVFGHLFGETIPQEKSAQERDLSMTLPKTGGGSNNK